MLISGVSDDPDVQAAVHIRPAIELSKMYVLPAYHGSGVAAALMERRTHRGREPGCRLRVARCQSEKPTRSTVLPETWL